MSKRLARLATLLVLPLLAAAGGQEPPGESEPAAGEEGRSFSEALLDSRFSVGLRYRLESVESDAPAAPSDATASTLRTTLGLRSAPFRGLSLYLEAEDVSVLGNDELFANAGAGSLANGVTDRPTVADPEITEIHQAFVEFERGPFRGRAGRTELSFGDERFVGPVGWRQNHQSFDALEIEAAAGDRLTARWAYLDRAHRITGAEEPMSSHALRLETRPGLGELVAFGYLLDYDRSTSSRLSTTTVGARWHGELELDPWSLLWELGLARQTDTGDNPQDFEESWLQAGVGVRRSDATLRLGFERLDGDGSVSFQTPLATLHKFNGWADVFVATPSDGLDDFHLRYDQSRGDWSWTVRLHDFEAASGDRSYGSELDAQLLWKASWGQAFALKLARYSADDLGDDVTKAMLYTTWSFSASRGER